MTKRWHVHAHGSTEHPNLDEYVDTIPDGLLYKYPFVSIRRIKPCSTEDQRSRPSA